MVRPNQSTDYRGIDAARRGRAGFGRSEDGSLIIFGLFLFIIMLMAGGVGVDFMRFEAQRTRLQSTLDRAVLAAASLDQPLSPGEVVLDYFARTGLSDYISADDITITDSLTARRVTANASMDVQTTFLRLAGINYLTSPANGAAEESASQTEISLVLDVSGSMGSWSSGTTKIDILRRSATDFVNIVLCNPANPNDTQNCTVEEGKVSVNLIPYSEQVTFDPNELSQFNVSTEHSASDCVTFDSSDFLTTALDQSITLKRTGHFDPWSSSYYSARNWTCATDSWRDVTLLGGSPANLRYEISRLQASGNTSIDVGMKWGSGLLDPSIQPVVGKLVTANRISNDFDGRPFDWQENRVAKVIVLMTDGVNTDQHYLYDFARTGLSPIWKSKTLGRYSIYNKDTGQYYWEYERKWMDHAFGTRTSYTTCTWVYDWRTRRYVEQCTQTPEDSGATQMNFIDLWAEKPWAWYEQFNWLPRPGSSFGNSTKNARLHEICNAAKDRGITVFTIGFEVTYSSGLVLRDCASSPAHFFDVQGLDLADAFSAIAREISKLRLVN